MKLMLTSAGIRNGSLRAALVGLLGKPIGECAALAIPTASYGRPNGMVQAYRYLTGQGTTPMCELGWKSIGVLEPAVLTALDRAEWEPRVREADVLLASGGDALFLAHWIRRSGLAELLPSFDGVYVGMSAGSMALTPRIGEDFVSWRPPEGGDATLGLVGFSLFPHLDHPMLPENTMADAERWAEGLGVPAYAIDDETAIRVADGAVDVVSEGHWRHFPG